MEASIKPNTKRAYASQRTTFKVWQKEEGKIQGRAMSEKDAYVAYAERNAKAGKPGTSMATLFYALKKEFVVTGDIHSAWINEPWVSTFVKGLKKEAGIHGKERLGLTIDMQRGLVQEAIKEGFEELAVGYGILFRALVRHDHLHRMRYDTIEQCPSFCKIWTTGWKGPDTDVQEGQWVKLVGMNVEIEQQIQRAKQTRHNHEKRLLPHWEENLAVSFVQRTAHRLGWPAGFKYDVHCLRSGGAAEQELAGATVSDLRIQGRWASECVHGYRATLAPNQELVPLSLPAPKLRRGKRTRIALPSRRATPVIVQKVKGKSGRTSNLLV